MTITRFRHLWQVKKGAIGTVFQGTQEECERFVGSGMILATQELEMPYVDSRTQALKYGQIRRF